jgi:hypothetical protein
MSVIHLLLLQFFGSVSLLVIRLDYLNLIGYLCCHLLTRVTWDSGKQRLYLCFRVLRLLNSIKQSITAPLIPHNKKNLPVNTNSIPRTLHTLKHVEKFKLRNYKNLHINWHLELGSHFLYIKKSIQCLQPSFIVLELLYFLLFTCWDCTITIKFTSPIHKQCDIA